MNHLVSAALCTALLTAPGVAVAATAASAKFGSLPSGEEVTAVTLRNAKGHEARLISYGATLQSLIVPDRDGKKADIVLGFATAADYADHGSYFGVTVGRYANRIAHGRFNLDGRQYQLARNEGGVSALHGGVQGFDKRNWKVLEVESGPVARVTFGLVSPDGDEGYPGTLTIRATYSLDDKGDLTVDYRAFTDKPTVVNLTNHALFNMAGEGSSRDALSNRLTIHADQYTPVDKDLIPTGKFESVAGTPFDFRQPTVIGEHVRDGSDPQMVLGRGYDHNYVLHGTAGELRQVARLEDPVSGRRLDLLSDQPGLQVYSGNFIDGTTVGKSGKIYRMGDGVALEPQHFPDSPNRPEFPAVRLDPGREYRNLMVFRLSTAERD